MCIRDSLSGPAAGSPGRASLGACSRTSAGRSARVTVTVTAGDPAGPTPRYSALSAGTSWRERLGTAACAGLGPPARGAWFEGLTRTRRIRVRAWGGVGSARGRRRRRPRGSRPRMVKRRATGIRDSGSTAVIFFNSASHQMRLRSIGRSGLTSLSRPRLAWVYLL